MYHLLAAKQERRQKAYLLTKKTEEFYGKKVRRMGEQAGKRQDTKSKGSRQKNKRGNSKMEPNDSPEISRQGETSDIPSLPSGSSTEGINISKTIRTIPLYIRK